MKRPLVGYSDSSGEEEDIERESAPDPPVKKRYGALFAPLALILICGGQEAPPNFLIFSCSRANR